MSKQIYIFKGGEPWHRRKNHKCTKGWRFETSRYYWMVYFLEDLKDGSPMCEICSEANLVKLEDFELEVV